MLRRAGWALPTTAVLLLSSVLWLVARNLQVLLAPPLPVQLHPVAAAPTGPRFVLLAQEYDHPYWQEIRRGAEAAAAEYGVALDYQGPRRHNPPEHLRLLDVAVAAQVHGVITPGLDAAAYDPYIAKAVDRGIPVVTVESDAPGSRRLSYVGSDQDAVGRLLARAVAEAAGGSGQVGVLLGGAAVPSQAFRLEGLRQGLAGYPNMQVATVQETGFSQIVATQEAWKMLQHYPQLRVLVGLSPYDAAGAVQAVQAAGRSGRVLVLGLDDLPETLAYLEQGDVFATVAEAPFTMGYRAVALLANYLRDQRPPQVVDTPIVLRLRESQP